MPGWRDIAEAPKDGTLVDLLYPHPHGRTVNCYWDTSEVAGGGMWVWVTPRWGPEGVLPETDWYTSCRPNMEPTHFRLPPAPPQQEPG